VGGESRLGLVVDGGRVSGRLSEARAERVEVGASEKGESWGLVVSDSSIGKDVETSAGRLTYRRPSQSISSPLLALRTISHDQRSLVTSVHSMVGIPIQVANRRSKRAETERGFSVIRTPLLSPSPNPPARPDRKSSIPITPDQTYELRRQPSCQMRRNRFPILVQTFRRDPVCPGMRARGLCFARVSGYVAMLVDWREVGADDERGWNRGTNRRE
jgi:hypothetical protein